MIELPRACLVAGEIAKEAEFFSFGTNDLTQTTFGFSRDDINKVLPTYLAEGILNRIRLRRSTRKVSANWCGSVLNEGERLVPSSKWESAANMAESRNR